MSRFTEKPLTALLADGRRLNLRHGPIDLIIDAEGPDIEVSRSLSRANCAFETVLSELAGELDLLRSPCTVAGPLPAGKIARKMHAAAKTHCDSFITPMAAVAGAVADHILNALTQDCGLRRASVNNGGDIALYLAAGTRYDIAICANPHSGDMAGNVGIAAEDGIRGIATSGWRGRSHSLGIADAVTVLACDAATADAAATMIANQVRLEGSPHVHHAPALDLSPDSDLGNQPVTIAVDDLDADETNAALHRGKHAAEKMVRDGLIRGAFLCLQGDVRIARDQALAVDEIFHEGGQQIHCRSGGLKVSDNIGKDGLR
jgi:ApbE superfamily uncharacterized protein (UPF0280 family)